VSALTWQSSVGAAIKLAMFDRHLPAAETEVGLEM
jgi:hypothetical protein